MFPLDDAARLRRFLTLGVDGQWVDYETETRSPAGVGTPANRAEGERFLRLCLNAAYAAFQHENGAADCEA